MYVRGEVFIPNCEPEVVIHAICDQEVRKSWDKILSGFTVFPTDRHDTQNVYFVTIPPIPVVATREFV